MTPIAAEPRPYLPAHFVEAAWLCGVPASDICQSASITRADLRQFLRVRGAPARDHKMRPIPGSVVEDFTMT